MDVVCRRVNNYQHSLALIVNCSCVKLHQQSLSLSSTLASKGTKLGVGRELGLELELENFNTQG